MWGTASAPVRAIALEALTASGLVPRDHVAVCLVGSVARGWANANSDHDFYVITGSPWRGGSSRTLPVPLRPNAVPSRSATVSGFRCEVKYWTVSQVDQMMAKVTWDQFERGTSSTKVLVDTEELFLERLITCVPVSGADWVADRRRALAGSAFQAFLVTASLAETDSSVEDALGQAEEQDFTSAVLSARKALGHAVDALLESHGNFGSRIPKWRAKRFLETAPRQLSFQEYWDLETMRDYDPTAPRVWLDRVLTLCRDLSLEVEIR